MIYFAMGGVAWAIPATGGTWTAISELRSVEGCPGDFVTRETAP